jgi:hypothetical protein
MVGHTKISGISSGLIGTSISESLFEFPCLQIWFVDMEMGKKKYTNDNLFFFLNVYWDFNLPIPPKKNYIAFWTHSTHTHIFIFKLTMFFIFRYGSNYFASCSQVKTAKLWTTDRIFPVRSFVGHTADVDVSYQSLVQ